MKHPNPLLITLWTAVILTIGIGSLSAVRSLSTLDRQTSLWEQKRNDLRELTRLRDRSRRFTEAVKAHALWPASPPPLQELLNTTLPGVAISPLAASEQPAPSNWITRKVTFSMTDVTGEALDRFFEAATTSRPPWSIEECTLQASTTSGRLARVDMVLVAVERTATGN